MPLARPSLIARPVMACVRGRRRVRSGVRFGWEGERALRARGTAVFWASMMKHRPEHAMPCCTKAYARDPPPETDHYPSRTLMASVLPNGIAVNTSPYVNSPASKSTLMPPPVRMPMSTGPYLPPALKPGSFLAVVIISVAM